MTFEWILLPWGLAVGLDLVSVGQFMISRPLVAGTVAGALVGDPVAGMTAGVVLELFALDVMPVGAVHYPDFGIGAVSATAVVAGAPLGLAIGIGILVGLGTAVLGELGIDVVRRANGAAARSVQAAIDAGDEIVIERLHRAGLLRDSTRALIVSALGLLLAGAIRELVPLSAGTTALLVLVLGGCALGTATAGALRVTGRTGPVGWLGFGALVGVILVVTS